MTSAISLDNDFLKDLYSEKKYDKIIEYLAKHKDLPIELKNKLGYAYFHNHEFDKAYEVFSELGKDYQKGQCQVMLGNLDKAYEIFDNAEPSSPILWGICLVELIQMKLSKPPSFLQIRNFFETDLNMFIECEKLEYAENLIKWSKLLSDLNSESYKFIGKVLLFNGYYKLASDYLVRSKEILPSDPESYYYLAQYYEKSDEIEIATKHLREAIRLNPEYTPAKIMLTKLTSINK